MTDYILETEPGAFCITAHPVGLVIEGDPSAPEGRRVVAQPALGGRSESRLDENGRALFASLVPAWRATRVDTVRILKAE